MAKDCLYCRLQFDDTVSFCPDCGRPTESHFIIRSSQETEVEHLREELKRKDELIRQLLLLLALRREASRTTHTYAQEHR